jgi:hypothetical protein
LRPGRGENHLSQQPVPGTHPALSKAAAVQRSTTLERAGNGAGRSEVPYLALHPMGFSVPPRLRSERWALTPPFHLDPRSCCHGRRQSVFCGTIRRDASQRRLPRVSSPTENRSGRLRGTAPFGVRTFLPPAERLGSDSPPFQDPIQIYRARNWRSTHCQGRQRRGRPRARDFGGAQNAKPHLIRGQRFAYPYFAAACGSLEIRADYSATARSMSRV